MTDRDDMREKATALLREHGFKLRIDGCGCCNSPWVKLEYNGELIVHEEGDDAEVFVVDMFKEDQT